MNLNPNDPDYKIEEFWYGFKTLINNFYTSIKYNLTSNTDINLWSDNLNKLKKEKKYELIEYNIINYISLFAIDIMKYEKQNYYDRLLLTFNKRWNKISQLIDNNLILNKKVILIFDIYLFIKDKNNNDTVINKFIDIELMLYLNDYDDIILYAVQNHYSKILDNLKNIPEYDLISNIKKLFPNSQFNENINMIKLVKILN